MTFSQLPEWIQTFLLNDFLYNTYFSVKKKPSKKFLKDNPQFEGFQEKRGNEILPFILKVTEQFRKDFGIASNDSRKTRQG
jgi:hypothetical protein